MSEDPDPLPVNELDIYLLSRPLPLEKEYRAWVVDVLRDLEIHWYQFSISFCSDDHIQTLNREWRHKDEATDVLSFAQDPAEHPDFRTEYAGHALYGDLVISLDTLRVNSEYFKVDVKEELKRLTIHGLLHLLGWDHSDNEPTQPMLLYQEQVLDRYKTRLFQNSL